MFSKTKKPAAPTDTTPAAPASATSDSAALTAALDEIADLRAENARLKASTTRHETIAADLRARVASLEAELQKPAVPLDKTGKSDPSGGPVLNFIAYGKVSRDKWQVVVGRMQDGRVVEMAGFAPANGLKGDCMNKWMMAAQRLTVGFQDPNFVPRLVAHRHAGKSAMEVGVSRGAAVSATVME